MLVADIGNRNIPQKPRYTIENWFNFQYRLGRSTVGESMKEIEDHIHFLFENSSNPAFRDQDKTLLIFSKWSKLKNANEEAHLIGTIGAIIASGLYKGRYAIIEKEVGRYNVSFYADSPWSLPLSDTSWEKAHTFLYKAIQSVTISDNHIAVMVGMSERAGNIH